MDDYLYGTDCLGDGFDSVMPWLSMFTGGFGGGSKDKAAAEARAREEEKRRQEALAAQARQSRNILIGVGVTAGLLLTGTVTYLVARK